MIPQIWFMSLSQYAELVGHCAPNGTTVLQKELAFSRWNSGDPIKTKQNNQANRQLDKRRIFKVRHFWGINLLACHFISDTLYILCINIVVLQLKSGCGRTRRRSSFEFLLHSYTDTIEIISSGVSLTLSCFGDVCPHVVNGPALLLFDRCEEHFINTPRLPKGFVKDILSLWKMCTQRATEEDSSLIGQEGLQRK